ncbi:PREDICTED: uncharacterized protein C10orf95-like, partial [Chinchilla lanigera]|uniref:uncharacterized protein C10orf95-like n=1 Tax=Chinchilla lanigera TaxID=34839 RepID=UPI0006988C06
RPPGVPEPGSCAAGPRRRRAGASSRSARPRRPGEVAIRGGGGQLRGGPGHQLTSLPTRRARPLPRRGPGGLSPRCPGAAGAGTRLRCHPGSRVRPARARWDAATRVRAEAACARRGCGWCLRESRGAWGARGGGPTLLRAGAACPALRSRCRKVRGAELLQ